jgi:hypothetical protein
MYDEISKGGIEVIALANYESDKATLRAMQKEFNITVPIGVDMASRKEPEKSTYARYASGWKTWYVVDSTLTVVYGGIYTAPKLRDAFQKLGVSWGKKTAF